MAEVSLQRASGEVDEADQALAALPATASAEALREAVKEACDAGPIDAALARVAALRDGIAAEAGRSLAWLALWRGDLAALEATSVPLGAEAAQLGAELEDAGVATRTADTALQDQDTAIETCRIAMLGIKAAGVLPTYAPGRAMPAAGCCRPRR